MQTLRNFTYILCAIGLTVGVWGCGGDSPTETTDTGADVTDPTDGAGCEEGFADCDEDDQNGCEVNLQISLENCGECGSVCGAENGTGECIGGVCAITCDAGFEQIDDGVCTDVDECDRELDDCDENASCTNEEGSFSCTCNDGFDGDGTACTDIDECTDGTSECGANASCVNEDGGFSCTCDDGYVGDGLVCEDIDECTDESDDCDENASCTNEEGGFSCACNDGYEGDGTTCTDIDECTVSTASCVPNATCTNEEGSFSCTCNDGYLEAEDGSCGDIDECALGTDNCAGNASCTNEAGSFSCGCNEGYTGDGVTCTDIDECAEGLNDCSVDASCSNLPGGFTCACNDGYEGDGVECADIDECAPAELWAEDFTSEELSGWTLLNSNDAVGWHVSGGSLVYSNASGTSYPGEHMGSAVSPVFQVHAGTMASFSIVLDLDDLDFTGGDLAFVGVALCDDLGTVEDCQASIAAESNPDATTWDTDFVLVWDKQEYYASTANDNELQVDLHLDEFTGHHVALIFAFDSVDQFYNDAKGVLVDNVVLQTLVHPTNTCSLDADCTNTVGSFACVCSEGFDGDGTVCTDIDECLNDPCHENASCTNQVGGFVCTCDEDYEGDGIASCVQNDDCIDHACPATASCVDGVNSYSCECIAPYSGDDCTTCAAEVGTTATNTWTLEAFFDDANCETVELASGTFEVMPLEIDRDVMLRGIEGGNTVLRLGIGTSGSVLTLESGDVTIHDLTIADGDADKGGGIHQVAGSLTLNEVSITDNVAEEGGGLYVAGAAALNNSSVTLNEAYSQDRALGGGIRVAEGGSLSFTNTNISSNTASTYGYCPTEPFQPGPYAHGGGIYTNGDIFGGGVIKNNLVNSCKTEGGALFVDHQSTGLGGTVELVGVEISDNKVVGESHDMGAIAVFVGTDSVTIRDSNLGAHEEPPTPELLEAAVYLYNVTEMLIENTVVADIQGPFFLNHHIFGGSLSIVDSQFMGNGSPVISVQSGTITVKKSVFEGNGATVLDLKTRSGSIEDSLFKDNNYGDGVVIAQTNPGFYMDGTEPTLNIRGCTFTGNENAIYNTCESSDDISKVNITNSTFANHMGTCVLTSDSGTGICESHLQLSQVTVAHNDGAGICALRGLSGSKTFTTVRGSLFWENAAGCNEDGGTFISEGNNWFGSAGSCALGGSDTVGMNPLLGPLEDNGGLTWTMKLLSGSGAVNEVPGCVDHNDEPITVDQRGEPRDVSCDVGAYEQ